MEFNPSSKLSNLKIMYILVRNKLVRVIDGNNYHTVKEVQFGQNAFDWIGCRST